ncbi:glucose oxidase [Chaetomium tenue]|uniref:Glucose oxidase n=1 Tax=Chaetomium tenue TaxID=1854479 RepID=A0ACB7PBL9_9PEZI|nr:glucose oxidase [Chaetomium globosum]
MAIIRAAALLVLASSVGVSGVSRPAIDSYDYIIIGAGTSGLVVANRLSEEASVTVAVIEPGSDERDNPNVTTTVFGTGLNTPVDWVYSSVNQSRAGNRAFDLHAGKAWGGTSAINGMTYIRGNVAEFDAWEELGNPGWNWNSIFGYFKKSEKYTIPTDSQLAAGATFESQYHGFRGPLHVGYTPALKNGSFAPVVRDTWAGLSVTHNPDLNSGDVRGYGMGPQTLDAALNMRWDAARAYLHPAEHRPNLKVLKGTVKRITWATGKHATGRLVADGVEVVTDDGKSTVLSAKKEIIVSAGALRTPLVLEGSGIGNPRILKSLGIETRVDLPGVGENLIEQPSHFLLFSGDLQDSSASAYHSYVTIADLFGADVAAVEAATRANIPKWAKAAADASGARSLDACALEKVLKIQHDLLFKHNVTAAEILLAIAPDNVLASNYWALFPFSRGSVHLKSADKINEPLVDPRIFLADFDLSIMVAAGKVAQKFWLSEPMKTKGTVIGPIVPEEVDLPNNATNAQWQLYLRDTVVANSHPTGTAAMMSRALGGVVDPELRVYGTANVRVVDASVVPLQVSGHLTATLYGLAERASDIIKRTTH